MSKEKTPEELAEERYPDHALDGNAAAGTVNIESMAFVVINSKRVGYAACYREHVLSAGAVTREEVSDPRHPDDIAVDDFAKVMKEKLAAARAKGRGGWEDPAQCTVQHLSDLLHEHVKKGDPRDVANLCMMLYVRGSGILPTESERLIDFALHLRALNAKVEPRDPKEGEGKGPSTEQMMETVQQWAEHYFDMDLDENGLMKADLRTRLSALVGPREEGQEPEELNKRLLQAGRVMRAALSDELSALVVGDVEIGPERYVDEEAARSIMNAMAAWDEVIFSIPSPPVSDKGEQIKEGGPWIPEAGDIVEDPSAGHGVIAYNEGAAMIRSDVSGMFYHIKPGFTKFVSRPTPPPTPS